MQSSPKPKALRTNSTSDDVTRPIESDRQQKRGPHPNGYGPLSAMTYLSNKDYLR